MAHRDAACHQSRGLRCGEAAGPAGNPSGAEIAAGWKVVEVVAGGLKSLLHRTMPFGIILPLEVSLREVGPFQSRARLVEASATCPTAPARAFPGGLAPAPRHLLRLLFGLTSKVLTTSA